MNEETERRERSLRFMEKIKGDSLEASCSRATVWCRGSLPPASGEESCEPSLRQAVRGQFEPDDASSLAVIASEAMFVSFDFPQLLPIRVTDVHPEGDNPHFHFEVTGSATKFPSPKVE